MCRSRGEGPLVGLAQARGSLLPRRDRGRAERLDVLSCDGFQSRSEVTLGILQHPPVGLIAQVPAGLGQGRTQRGHPRSESLHHLVGRGQAVRQAPGLDEAQRHVSPARHGQNLVRIHGRQTVDIRVGRDRPLDLGQQGARADEDHVRVLHLPKRAQNQRNVAPGREEPRMQVQDRALRNPQLRAQVDDAPRARRGIRHDNRIHARVGLAVPLRDRFINHGHHVRAEDIAALDHTLEALAQASRPHRLRLQLMRVVRKHRARAPRQRVREGKQEQVLRGDGRDALPREPPVHANAPRPDDPHPAQGRTQGRAPNPSESHGGGHGLVRWELALIDPDDVRLREKRGQ